MYPILQNEDNYLQVTIGLMHQVKYFFGVWGLWPLFTTTPSQFDSKYKLELERTLTAFEFEKENVLREIFYVHFRKVSYTDTLNLSHGIQVDI